MFMLLPLVCGALISKCPADELEEALQDLRAADHDWSSLLSASHIVAAVSMFRDGADSPHETFEFEFSQLQTDLWRLDLRRGKLSSLVRDRDFVMSIAGKSNGRYDRLGFDAETHASIERSLIAQNTLLAGATHVLDVPLSQFITMNEVRWDAVEAPTRRDSVHRLRWTIPPENDAGFRPASGAIEWVKNQSRCLLTRSEYSFGQPATNRTAAIVVEVWYEQFDDHLLPVRVIRTETGLRTETVRQSISRATTDTAFYSSEAFGLVRPSKPWPAFRVWALLAMAATGAGVALRWWRTRPYKRRI
jgi:hypothetical protein